MSDSNTQIDQSKLKVEASSPSDNGGSKVEEAEILETLPPEVKKVIEMGFSMQRISGSMPNPLLSKVTEGHINKILEIADKEENNSFSDKQSSKKYNAFYFLISILFVVFLIVFLVGKDKDLLLAIIEKSTYFLGGFGSGYGVKVFIDSKKK